METEELTIGRVHHGRNIRRTRIEKDMNQEGLSELVHLSQPAVSKYEKMKVIDDEMLQRFARALNVPFDYLKTLEEDAQTVVFENNTVNNSEQSAGGANISMGIVKSDTEDSINDSRVNNFNPIDKITELYERLLKEKEMEPEDITFAPENLAKLIALADKGTINSTVAKEVFEVVFTENTDPEQYVKEHGLSLIHI